MTRPRAFVSCQIVGSALERLNQAFAVEYRNSPYPASAQEFLAGAKNADAIVSLLDDEVSASVMDQCPQLKAIANVAVGFNNIDIDAATQRGILVLNTPGVLTNATAESHVGAASLCSASRNRVRPIYPRRALDGLVRRFHAGSGIGWENARHHRHGQNRRSCSQTGDGIRYENRISRARRKKTKMNACAKNWEPRPLALKNCFQRLISSVCTVR